MPGESVVVWGAGGHAAVVADILLDAGYVLGGFVSGDATEVGARVSGFSVSVVCTDPDLRTVLSTHRRLPAGSSALALGIGDNRARMSVLHLAGDLLLAPLIHSSATVSPRARIDAGAVVFPNAVVNARAHIERAAIVNSGAIIEHDCHIGEGAHISPGAVIAGGATVEKGAWVGAGAVVLPGVIVESFALVGAGAVAVHSVSAGSIVVGIPARHRA